MPSDPDVIEKEIVVRTTPEKAFRALTSEEDLRRWFVPHTALKFSSHSGGSYEMAGKGGPGPDWMLQGAIVAYEPNRHLAYTWNCTWTQAGSRTGTQAQTLVEWWIDDLGDGTVKIRLRHSGWSKDPDNRASHEGGWPRMLAQLENHLSGREVVVRTRI